MPLIEMSASIALRISEMFISMAW